MYRELTSQEIRQMEQQGCRCQDWSQVMVADGFNSESVRGTAFDGEVRIGAGCTIDNVGIIRTTDDATFGQGIIVSVLNEAGDGNVMLFPGLTSQLAALMVRHENEPQVLAPIHEMIRWQIKMNRPECTTIGNSVSISWTRELTNVIIGDDCEISGASRLVDCTLSSSSEASILISDGVIAENAIVQAGASITDHARIYDTFVGEACHVGRGFTSENSIFFANSFMDNGESCAAFCGPFTVSHHKSTLLIGGEHSFYNAGSGTNFSNHAYKMGPIHWGQMLRGSKTASGSHILWPATIGAFSMVMGKIETHPDTTALPFSYVFGNAGATTVVPGRNISTVGTWRDVSKWPKRDMRPRQGRRTIVCQDWLSPAVVATVLNGRDTLLQLQREQGSETALYQMEGFSIRNNALQKGLKYYELIIRLYIAQALRPHVTDGTIVLPQSTIGSGNWFDLSGLPVPESELTALSDEIRQGTITDLEDITDRFRQWYESYDTYKWAWTYSLITRYHGLDTLTADDAARILEDCEAARQEWVAQVRYDAEKEFAMGDVSEAQLSGFLDKM